MKEFGSDYHFIKTSSKCENTIFDLFPNAIYLADGRQTMELLVNHNKWKRIWIPSGISFWKSSSQGASCFSFLCSAPFFGEPCK